MFPNIKQIVKISKQIYRGDCTTEKNEPVKLGTEKKEALGAPEEKMLVGHEEHKELPANREKELEERILRLQAEFENYKKRAAKENAQVREFAAADILLKLLPVVDEFEIAMAHVDKSPHKEFKHGMELIYVKLRDMLKKEGVEEMKALGEMFDPYRHDGIRQGEGEEGKIVDVIQKGYALRGKVLRHAKVVVGKKKEVGG